jgi:peptidoglycan/LPS O-acetylase OafA/YrhL
VTAKRTRLYYIDNLRILLTILVLLWHLAITYGADGGWPYRESRPDEATAIVYTLFGLINNPYVLGFFFLIAGYFTPRSLDRKGAARFAIDRLLRLGIPIAFYVLVFDPVIEYGIRAGVRNYGLSLWEYLRLHFSDYTALGVGPMWFAEALLLFSLAYALLRVARRRPFPQRETSFPGPWALTTFALVVGLATFVARIWLPVGSEFELLGLRVWQLPQHFALFLTGILAYRRGWLGALENRTGKLWAVVAAILVVVVMPVMFVVGGALESGGAEFMGGLHWQALFSALWEQFVAVGMILALLVWFRNRFNSQGRIARALSDSTYAVYFVHAPVLVFLALSLRGLQLHPLLKFALVAPVATILCFAVGYGLRRLPLLRRIL